MASLAPAILPASRLRLPTSTSSLSSKFSSGRYAMITQKTVQKPLVLRSQGTVRMAASVAPARTAGIGGRGRQNMEGKVVVVTGANTGMGVVIARELALQGAKVVMACRSETKGKAAEASVLQAVRQAGGGGEAHYAELDLSKLASVRKFADWFSSSYGSLDCLINNAGIMIPPYTVTADGFESQFQVNHLSHYLLTRLLTPVMEATAGTPSIIHVSSLAGEQVGLKKGEFQKIARCPESEYNAFEAYRRSKLAQVLFTVEMNRRMGKKITVNALHPGIVNTELFSRNLPPLAAQLLSPLGWFVENSGIMYTAEKGASTAIHLATSTRESTGSGGYFADCSPKPANPIAFDPDLGKEWWEESALAAGLEA